MNKDQTVSIFQSQREAHPTNSHLGICPTAQMIENSENGNIMSKQSKEGPQNQI